MLSNGFSRGSWIRDTKLILGRQARNNVPVFSQREAYSSENVHGKSGERSRSFITIPLGT